MAGLGAEAGLEVGNSGRKPEDPKRYGEVGKGNCRCRRQEGPGAGLGVLAGQGKGHWRLSAGWRRMPGPSRVGHSEAWKSWPSRLRPDLTGLSCGQGGHDPGEGWVSRSLGPRA